jgi:hypothetical protein
MTAARPLMASTPLSTAQEVDVFDRAVSRHREPRRAMDPATAGMSDRESGRAPDLIAPVIGFRQWRLIDDGLSSLTREVRWPGGTLTARCDAGGHGHEPPPAADCSCGIYAWYAPSPRTASAGTPDYVTGAVVLWGAIELHATGMRAERCRIVALALPLSRWRKRDRLLRVARRLEVPAVPHRALWTVARDHGATIPRALRPPREWASLGQGPMGVVPSLLLSATTPRRRR